MSKHEHVLAVDSNVDSLTADEQRWMSWGMQLRDGDPEAYAAVIAMLRAEIAGDRALADGAWARVAAIGKRMGVNLRDLATHFPAAAS